MNTILCELISGGRAEICTLGLEASGAFSAFLDGLDEEIQQRVLCLLDHISRHNVLENEELFSPVRGAVGLFKAKIGGVEMAFFRCGSKLVLCRYVHGVLSAAQIEQAKWCQTSFLGGHFQQQKLAS